MKKETITQLAEIAVQYRGMLIQQQTNEEAKKALQPEIDRINALLDQINNKYKTSY